MTRIRNAGGAWFGYPNPELVVVVVYALGFVAAGYALVCYVGGGITLMAAAAIGAMLGGSL